MNERKLIVLSTLYVLLFIVGLVFVFKANADELSVTMTNGRTMTWGSYWEQGEDYCTQKAGGIICFPKNQVKEIKEIKEVEYGANTRVIEPSSGPKGRVSSFSAGTELNQKWQADIKASEERNERYHERRDHLTRDHNIPIWEADWKARE
jgi:hypothetical protein